MSRLASWAEAGWGLLKLFQRSACVRLASGHPSLPPGKRHGRPIKTARAARKNGFFLFTSTTVLRTNTRKAAACNAIFIGSLITAFALHVRKRNKFDATDLLKHKNRHKLEKSRHEHESRTFARPIHCFIPPVSFYSTKFEQLLPLWMSVQNSAALPQGYSSWHRQPVPIWWCLHPLALCYYMDA